jgi:hypothetical protein
MTLEQMLELLIPVLIVIESGGDNLALGRNGEIGALQIKPITLDDCNRICELRKIEKRYRKEDLLDREKSIAICKVILREYGNKLEEDGDLSIESLALTWNMGYRSFRTRPANDRYAEKVQIEFNRKHVARI